MFCFANNSFISHLMAKIERTANFFYFNFINRKFFCAKMFYFERRFKKSIFGFRKKERKITNK
jgi:hypothetical protein